MLASGSGVAGEGRNLIIFVADGLRAGSVSAEDAPTMTILRNEGVSFGNSHSLFPTFTTPNAAAIATGHYLGDTGDFGNGLYLGYRLFDTGNFGRHAAGSTAFIESDAVLGDLDAHLEGNFLGEDSLIALARAHGYATAAIGKLGPVAIQDVTQLQPQDSQFATPQTILIDDATGTDGVPLDREVAEALARAGLPRVTPPRQQPAGDGRTPGVRAANLAQQQYFVAVTTRVLLPLLRQRGLPFVLLYWSRDPDGTQHNQGDSLNALEPGINGPSSHAAVRNADDNLHQILEFVRADPALAANTDIFVTSDHGFATISKHDLDAHGSATASAAAHEHYDDVPADFLPPGFLALDLARALGQPLYDADRIVADAQGHPRYARVTTHPISGNGIIGGSGAAVEPSDAEVIVAANGGSDLLYVPEENAATVRRLARLLVAFDYVGALFVDDRFGPIPGALPLSQIALEGSAKLPRPALIVGFRTFLRTQSLQSAVQIADTTLQQGQGMHGSLGRDNTFNFMAAIGPDFKRRYVDELPASNADIAPTLLHVLGWPSSRHGRLVGRALTEALLGGAMPVGAQHCRALSAAAVHGRRTVLEYQQLDGRRYFDQAQLRAAKAGERTGCGR